MILLNIRNSVREILMRLRIAYLNNIWGHHLHPSAKISFTTYLDRTNPKGIVIGAETILTRGVVMLAHDFSRSWTGTTSIGARCFVGVNAIIMPGVTIGDEVVIGAGAVVTKDIRSGSVAIGNPARVVRTIRATAYGQIIENFPAH